MLTLRRFEALAASYGADLARWPDDVRDSARALVDRSPHARALLDRAQRLDAAVALAGSDAAQWGSGGQSAALARLRSGVQARIAAVPQNQRAFRLGLSWADLRWVGMVTGAGCAVTAGLVIGANLSVPPPSGETLQALLQPAPIGLLED
jgi:hypothetical protein